MPVFLYERRLLNEPVVESRLVNIYYGYEEPSNVTLELSNADGFFTSLIQSEELRNKLISISRYEPEEGTSLELTGVITEFELADGIFKVSVAINNPDPLQSKLARKVLETNDWAWGINPTPYVFLPSKDLGKPYQLLFGYCKKVPALYVKCDYTNDRYDYIVGYGEIEDIVNIYRDKRLININAEGITYNKGDSNSPYFLTINGQTVYFAYIRFNKEQRDFNGNLYTITVDVKGMKLGHTNMQKNFARVIQHILTNQAWGLGLTVDATSFNTAASTISSIFPECNDYVSNLDGGCSGAIVESVVAYDVIAELLLASRSRLETNESGQWTIKVDTYQQKAKVTLAEDDGFYNNCEVLSLSKTPTTSAIKNIIIDYGYDYWSSKYTHRITKNCRGFGEDVTYEFLLINDHLTVNKVATYLKNLTLHDTKLKIKAGMEARVLECRDVFRLISQNLNIDDLFVVQAIERSANVFTIEASSYSSSIYNYVEEQLPADPYQDALPDYSFTPPAAPTNLAIDSWGIAIGLDGTTFPTVVLKADAPSANIEYLEFATRKTGDSIYTWERGSPPASGSTWKGSLMAITSGLYYDFACRAVNKFGLYSQLAVLNNILVPGDTTAPASVTGVTGRCKVKTWEFQWNAVSAVDLKGYRVQINSASNFSGTMYLDTISNATKISYTNDTLSYGTTLYCRVKAVDYTGNESTAWSSVASATANRVTGGSSGDIDSGTITAINIVNNAISQVVSNSVSNYTITNSNTEYEVINVTITAEAGDDIIVLAKTNMIIQSNASGDNLSGIVRLYEGTTLLDTAYYGIQYAPAQMYWLYETVTCLAMRSNVTSGNKTYKLTVLKYGNVSTTAADTKIYALRVRR